MRDQIGSYANERLLIRSFMMVEHKRAKSKPLSNKLIEKIVLL